MHRARVARRKVQRRVVHSFILFLVFLQLCSAQNVICTVSQRDGLTHYSVPEFTETACEYSWTKNSDKVLANHNEKTEEPVVKKGNRTLITRECLELINYKRDCISEETPREAKCNIDCSRNADSQKNGGGISRNHWCAVAVNIMLLLLFLC